MIMSLLKKLLESYLVVLLFALSVGLMFPKIGLSVAPYATLFLQIIFFLSSLKLDVHLVREEVKNIRDVILANVYMLILFPIVTFVIVRAIAPQFAMPLLLLAAMPAGMTSMLLTELVGGDVSFSLLLTMTTSLLAPITIPLMMQLLAGATVAVSFWAMFSSLATVIVIPFLVAQIIRHLAHEKIRATFVTFKPISLALLGLLILGIVGRESDQIIHHFSSFLPAFFALVLFFLALHGAGYLLFPRLAHAKRLAATVCLTYMNFTLAIYLAGKFFPDPAIVIPVILSVFPWSIGMVMFQGVVRRRSMA